MRSATAHLADATIWGCPEMRRVLAVSLVLMDNSVKYHLALPLAGTLSLVAGPCGPNLRRGCSISHNWVVGSFVSLAGLYCAATHADLLIAVLSSRCSKPYQPTWQGSSC